MKRAILVWLILIGLLSLLMACADPSRNVIPEASIFFPRQPQTEAGAHEDTLDLLDGKLILVGSCLRVKAPETGKTYLPVWPPDYTLHTEDEGIEVLNGDGQPVARVGEEVHLSGSSILHRVGGVPIAEPVPAERLDNCGGPWLMVKSAEILDLISPQAPNTSDERHNARAQGREDAEGF